jgi:putative effector of murein hydrolase
MIVAPVFVALTLAAYGIGLYAHAWVRHHLLLLPVVVGAVVVAAALGLGGVSYPTYAEAVRPLSWLTGTATVALAVPLYRHAKPLRALARPLAVALTAGCVTSVIATTVVARLFGIPWEVALSLAPKSATMPMAIAAAERSGAIASIAALAVVLTGVSGVLVVKPITRVLGTRDDVTYGFTTGLVAHAIGVSSVIRSRPEALAYAAVGMGINGLATALLLPVVAKWVR